MSAIRGKNTRPEIAVRRFLYAEGFRFRLHRRDLPGCPDIVLPRFRAALMVNGCFWHVHACPLGQVRPKTNAEFWENKRRGNVERDARKLIALRGAGWRVRVVWECEVESGRFRDGLCEWIAGAE